MRSVMNVSMTSDRPYRKALPIKHAINELREFTGTQFDPHVVEAFIKVLEKEAEAQAGSRGKKDNVS